MPKTTKFLAILFSIGFLNLSSPTLTLATNNIIDLEQHLTTDTPYNFGILYRIWRVEPTIQGIIELIIIIASIIFFICILFSGFQWLTAGGDANDIATAKGRLSNCLVGLAITMLAWAVMLIIQYFFGVSVFPSS